MDHKLAEQNGTVERYLLNELMPDERVSFEEHLFDCPICGDLVRSGAISIENLKEVFRKEPARAAAIETIETKRFNWATWFRLPNLVPSFAAATLLALVCYQNFVYIPSLQRPAVLSDNVIAPATRSEAPTIQVDRNRPLFNMNFAVDSPRVYALYTCEFQRQGQGTVLKMDSGPRQFASFTLNLLLPQKEFPAGHYVMIVRPKTEPDTEIQRYEFVIE